MDPDAALTELQVICARVRAEHRLSQADVDRAGELFDALDGWLSRGGFLPSAWHLSTCMAHNCRGGASAAEHGGE